MEIISNETAWPLNLRGGGFSLFQQTALDCLLSRKQGICDKSSLTNHCLEIDDQGHMREKITRKMQAIDSSYTCPHTERLAPRTVWGMVLRFQGVEDFDMKSLSCISSNLNHPLPCDHGNTGLPHHDRDYCSLENSFSSSVGRGHQSTEDCTVRSTGEGSRVRLSKQSPNRGNESGAQLTLQGPSRASQKGPGGSSQEFRALLPTLLLLKPGLLQPKVKKLKKKHTTCFWVM